MSNSTVPNAIDQGGFSLGIELGSTRIKAVLIDKNHAPIASGGFGWENQLVEGMWTYSLDNVWKGVQTAYAALAANVQIFFGVPLQKVGGIGISAMMHGYLVFDAQGKQLVPFRTWRNTSTEQAAKLLSDALSFNIPQRWSAAHLYQAVLNKEPHREDIAFFTTLAGYVHWKLTGEKVLGVGDASGMFPINSTTGQYNNEMLQIFDEMMAEKGFAKPLATLLPKVLNAGEMAGTLSAKGAKLLDPSGALQAGIPLCPPEGDAGTGMVATNAVAPKTGNVSAGTSIFAMSVLEKELSQVYTEIDMVTTPHGKPVAMVHCNNCSGDLDAWLRIFTEVLEAVGVAVEKPALYDAFYAKALEGDADCGGLVNYNYFSGEPITGLEEGRPLFMRLPTAKFTLANFARCQLFSAMATLKIGMDILLQQEKVNLTQLLGHGGLFKTPHVGQYLMAAAMNVPVAVMETAGEGGAWGIAVLAAYMEHKEQGETLDAYLAEKVFSKSKKTCVQASDADVKGFARYMERYKAGLSAQRAAVENLR